MKKQSLIYYAGRIIQRLSLLFVVGWTVIHWAILINITSNLGLFGQSNLTFDNPELVNESVKKVINLTSYRVLGASVGAAIVTVLFSLLARVRKHEKRLIVDSLVLIAFCLISVTLSQILIRYFLTVSNI